MKYFLIDYTTDRDCIERHFKEQISEKGNSIHIIGSDNSWSQTNCQEPEVVRSREQSFPFPPRKIIFQLHHSKIIIKDYYKSRRLSQNSVKGSRKKAKNQPTSGGALRKNESTLAELGNKVPIHFEF
jgi:hypothetical protein